MPKRNVTRFDADLRKRARELKKKQAANETLKKNAKKFSQLLQKKCSNKKTNAKNRRRTFSPS